MVNLSKPVLLTKPAHNVPYFAADRKEFCNLADINDTLTARRKYREFMELCDSLGI